MSIKVLILALFLTFIPFTSDGGFDITPLEVTPFDPSTLQVTPNTAEPTKPVATDPIGALPKELEHFNELPIEIRGANLFFAGINGYSEVFYDEGSGVLYIRGAILPETLDAVLSIDPKKIHTVDIHSVGGYLETSMMLATYIRHYEMDTYVRPYGVCYSGCTVIFQAGVNRTAATTAQFMYHFPSYNQSMFPEEFQFIEDRMLFTSGNRMWKFMQDQGIDPKFTEAMVPGTDRFATPRELMDYNVVKDLDDGHWKLKWLLQSLQWPFGINLTDTLYHVIMIEDVVEETIEDVTKD